MEPRHQKLAEVLTGHSTRLHAGEFVLIDAIDVPESIVIAIVRAARACGAVPFVNLQKNRINREIMRQGEGAHFEVAREWELARMERMQAYIALRGSDNIYETSDVDPERMTAIMAALKPVQNYRVSKTKWVVLRWPTPGMAQQAGRSTEAFEDFYFDVCTMDYGHMASEAAKLKALMEKAREVRISGPGTELRFHIGDIPVLPCSGERNIPDGECFTAPIKDSVEGYITYTAPTVYQGTSFDNIRLEFDQGKIVKATADKTERLNQILDSDEGSRYIGEFAIGFNPYITDPMRDILFDEKIAGSFHFTPGQAYEIADNGNRSQVHWDMVCIQTPEYGGGTISFDGEIVRENGRFIHPDLLGLNPENLRS